MNRMLNDERIKARDLYVLEGWTPAKIAGEICVNINTIYKWRKDDGWDSQRKEVLSSPLQVSSDIKDIIADFVKDLHAKVKDKNFIADSQIERLKKLITTAALLDSKHDARATSLFVMKKFTKYLQLTGEKEVLKEMPRILSAFYQTLIDE